MSDNMEEVERKKKYWKKVLIIGLILCATVIGIGVGAIMALVAAVRLTVLNGKKYQARVEEEQAKRAAQRLLERKSDYKVCYYCKTVCEKQDLKCPNCGADLGLD